MSLLSTVLNDNSGFSDFLPHDPGFGVAERPRRSEMH